MTSRIVEAILGDNATVHWYTRTKQQIGKFTAIAERRGFNSDISSVLRRKYIREKNNNTLPYGFDGFEIFKDWVIFIGGLVGDKNRCILLQWYRHAPTVEWSLSKFYRLQSLVIHMPDMTLGGALGKYGNGATGPVIDPPHFESLTSWLESKPGSVAVAELIRYLTVGEPIVSGVTGLAEEEDSAMKGDDLRALMLHWKGAFFRSWS